MRQTQARKVGGNLHQQRHVRLGHLDDLGDQQGLRGDAIIRHLALEFFIDQPFVGGVLVDNDHPIGGLGDDVVLVDLRAGST